MLLAHPFINRIKDRLYHANLVGLLATFGRTEANNASSVISRGDLIIVNLIIRFGLGPEELLS